jgi:hypothetical protein
MMLGLGLVLLFAPEALSQSLTALALILAALAVTALGCPRTKRPSRDP